MALSERSIRIKLAATVLAALLSLSVFAPSSCSQPSPVLQGHRGSSLWPFSGCRERSRKMVPGCEYPVQTQTQTQSFQMLAKRRRLTPPPAPVRGRAGHFVFIRAPPPPNTPPPPPAITWRDPRTKRSKCAPPPPPHY